MPRDLIACHWWRGDLGVNREKEPSWKMHQRGPWIISNALESITKPVLLSMRILPAPFPLLPQHVSLRLEQLILER